MSRKLWKIYCLCDPETGEPRYVGKTTGRLRKRLVSHIYESVHMLRGDTHKSRWIRKLLRNGLSPTIQLIRSGTEAGWEQIEIETIAEYRNRYGNRLLNIAPGGGGWTDEMPENVREKIRKKAIGRKLSDETRRRMSLAKKGKPLGPQTEEHRRNSTNARKGLRPSKEWCENQSKLMTGRKRSPIPWEELQAIRKQRYQKKADILGIPVEELPEYCTTPEMIDTALAETGQVKEKAARLLGVPVGMVRSHCSRIGKVQ